jgi:hypothetical protein
VKTTEGVDLVLVLATNLDLIACALLVFGKLDGLDGQMPALPCVNIHVRGLTMRRFILNIDL